jgi:hypothetical protein
VATFNLFPGVVVQNKVGIGAKNENTLKSPPIHPKEKQPGYSCQYAYVTAVFIGLTVASCNPAKIIHAENGMMCKRTKG